MESEPGSEPLPKRRKILENRKEAAPQKRPRSLKRGDALVGEALTTGFSLETPLPLAQEELGKDEYLRKTAQAVDAHIRGKKGSPESLRENYTKGHTFYLSETSKSLFKEPPTFESLVDSPPFTNQKNQRGGAPESEEKNTPSQKRPRTFKREEAFYGTALTDQFLDISLATSDKPMKREDLRMFVKSIDDQLKKRIAVLTECAEVTTRTLKSLDPIKVSLHSPKLNAALEKSNPQKFETSAIEKKSTIDGSFKIPTHPHRPGPSKKRQRVYPIKSSQSKTQPIGVSPPRPVKRERHSDSSAG